MSDFTFPCPGCGQHISCDVSNSGMQIQCPSCKAALTVPAAPIVPVAHVLSIAASQAKSHAASQARAHAAPPSQTQWQPASPNASGPATGPKKSWLKRLLGG